MWKRVPGRAIGVGVTVAVALTGCATSGNHPSSSPGLARPATAVRPTTAASDPAPQEISTVDPNGALVPAPATPPPRCSPVAGPLFCSDGTDDPATFSYFSRLHLKIMSLSPAASQSQAVSAICADLGHASVGTVYSAYLLAATKEHWFFTGIAKVHGKLSSLCPKK